MCTCTSALTQRSPGVVSQGLAGTPNATSVVAPAATSMLRRCGVRSGPFITSTLTLPAGTSIVSSPLVWK